MSSPILLLQWLKPDDYRETKTALAEFAKEVNIAHADVQKKADAKGALDTWFANNRDNLQFAFVGAHGIKDKHGKFIGIGASGEPEDYATWTEIWQWMGSGQLTGGLWLGSCKSADAAAALSPLLAEAHRIVIPWIMGFSEEIYPKEIENVLRQLVKNTDTGKVVFLDEELDLIREAVPNTKVVMFYPAVTKEGKREYVNVDEFEQKVGKTFRKHLDDGG